MANVMVTEKGFRVIQCSSLESQTAFKGRGVCDCCGESVKNGYYVPVLNYWLCSACFSEWDEEAIRYPEEVTYEEQIFQWGAVSLGIGLPCI